MVYAQLVNHNFTRVALLQPKYKKPNDVETSGQSQNFDGAVSGRFPSHTVYTKNDLFWPAAGAKKRGILTPNMAAFWRKIVPLGWGGGQGVKPTPRYRPYVQTLIFS